MWPLLDSDVLKVGSACATAHDLGPDPQIPRSFEEVPLHLYLAFFSVSTFPTVLFSHNDTLQPSGIKRKEPLSQWPSCFATPDTGEHGEHTGHGEDKFSRPRTHLLSPSSPDPHSPASNSAGEQPWSWNSCPELSGITGKTNEADKGCPF